jgi:Glycosyl transferase family 2
MGRDMRIFGHMVTRNEADRYLTPAVRWLQSLTDGQFIYDDRSTDTTTEVLDHLGVAYAVRPEDVLSFAEDESALRAEAWRAMEARCGPEPGDWILCVDADEFVTAPRPGRTRGTLETAAQQSIDIGSVTFAVNEIFGFDHDGTPLARIDGYWGMITACRFVRWRPDGRFAPRIEGGGSVPTDWATANIRYDLELMHFGYACAEDRTTKHARYSASGHHNRRHIESILTTPTLERWHSTFGPWRSL